MHISRANFPFWSNSFTKRNREICARDINRQVKRDLGLQQVTTRATKPKLYFRTRIVGRWLTLLEKISERPADRQTEEIRPESIRLWNASFFLKALEAGRTRGEEVIKNLSRIWRPFFFIGVLHFPRCTTIFHGDTGSQPPPLFPPIFPPSFSLSLAYLFPFICPCIFLRSSLSRNSDQASLNFPRRPSYLFPPRFFPFHEKTRRVDQKRDRERWQ